MYNYDTIGNIIYFFSFTQPINSIVIALQFNSPAEPGGAR
jgi:hypothetical protein